VPSKKELFRDKQNDTKIRERRKIDNKKAGLMPGISPAFCRARMTENFDAMIEVSAVRVARRRAKTALFYTRPCGSRRIRSARCRLNSKDV
jgi:hypothetical protein